MPPNLRLFMPDPDGQGSYPIITYSWLLLRKDYQDQSKWDKLKEFVTCGLEKGQKFAPDFGYAPLPEEVVTKALEALNSIK